MQRLAPEESNAFRMIASRREFPWCSRQLLPVLMGFSG